MFERVKAAFNNPAQAVKDGSAVDWFLVFGVVILINAGWYLVLKHMKGDVL